MAVTMACVVGVIFPGQVGFPVGYTAAPGFSSLTAWPGGTGNQTISDGTNATSGSGTSGDPWLFKYFDFDGSSATGGTLISVSNAKFIGCRFQSNSRNNYNVQTSGSNLTFSYCSMVPRTAFYTAPPNAAWPSAGAGLQIVPGSGSYTNTGNFCTIVDQSYQYGINTLSGSGTIDHCDFWGFGNAIVFQDGSSGNWVVSSNWIHDAANCNVTPTGGSTNYHTDGPGHLNGGAPPSNITIIGNTIASIGNTNGIAFQGASSGYSNISVTRNFFSGFAHHSDIGHNTSGNNNLTFTDNIFGTDLPWIFSPLQADFTTQFTGGTNLWRRNTFRVLPGTSPNSGATPSFTSANNGQFLLPDGTLSVTDFTG